jgi:DNA repair exonuclease SbcCD ATPase subunit
MGDSAASSRGGAASSAGAPSTKASNGGVEGEASIPESLLAAKTLQEVEAIVARVFSSDGGSSAASGSTYSGSNGGSATAGIGLSRLSGTGTRDSMPGGEDVAAEAHLAAELHRYKQQVQELQEAKDALQAEALLANAKAEEVAELQAANEQLVLQINVLNQAAEHASSGQQQQLEAAELLQQLEALRAANAGLEVGKQELASSMQDLQGQLEQLQQERERLQQQNARLHWLEEELLDLQLQIADLVQQNKDLAAELAAAKLQQLAKAGMHSDASMQSAACDSAAVSAVRAATQSLMQVS